jgi:hypothetical protein
MEPFPLAPVTTPELVLELSKPVNRVFTWLLKGLQTILAKVLKHRVI